MLFQDGSIEFRYQSVDLSVVSSGLFSGTTIVGLEDGAGARGVGVDLDEVVSGASVRLAPLDGCAPACLCETDGAAGVDVFDLLAYLELWFAQDAAADVDGAPGVDVFDLLMFLDCWFGWC